MNKDYERLKAWRAKNKDKVKAQAKRDYQRRKANGTTGYAKAKLDHYVVYYLPKEHYCGHTNNIQYRLSAHRRKNNRDTDGWIILYCCETKVEAAHVEAMYQSVLGMNGLNFRNNY